MGAGASLSVSVSPAARPLVQHCASALSVSPPATADPGAVQAALSSALRTAGAADIKRFCADRGIDTISCLEKPELIAAALPHLLRLATAAAKTATRPSGRQPAGGPRPPAQPTSGRGRQPRYPASGSPCHFCKAPMLPTEDCVRISAVGGVKCHASCVHCAEAGCAEAVNLLVSKVSGP